MTKNVYNISDFNSLLINKIIKQSFKMNMQIKKRECWFDLKTIFKVRIPLLLVVKFCLCLVVA